MNSDEIAKEITVAFTNRLTVLNVSEVEDAAKKIGGAYKEIFTAVRSAEPPIRQPEVKQY